MRLYRTEGLFRDVHRSGWAACWDVLNAVQDGNGLWLDDFVDASYTYRPQAAPHLEPWVGIFHHPVVINSPIREDAYYNIMGLFMTPEFNKSLPHLRGAIALSPSVADAICSFLKVPTFLIEHPSEENVPHWDADNGAAHRLWQTGWFLRDTQFINRLDTSRFETVHRSAPHLSWHRQRDKKLRRIWGIRLCRENGKVQDVPRLDNQAYDEYMASHVVCMNLFGASANNVLVECAARCAPLLVTRLPETEYYLGANYPLFFEPGNIEEAQSKISRDDLIFAAHEYLKCMPRDWLKYERFATSVKDFVSAL